MPCATRTTRAARAARLAPLLLRVRRLRLIVLKGMFILSQVRLELALAALDDLGAQVAEPRLAGQPREALGELGERLLQVRVERRELAEAARDHPRLHALERRPPLAAHDVLRVRRARLEVARLGRAVRTVYLACTGDHWPHRRRHEVALARRSPTAPQPQSLVAPSPPT